jgi:hypothetical protein
MLPVGSEDGRRDAVREPRERASVRDHGGVGQVVGQIQQLARAGVANHDVPAGIAIEPRPFLLAPPGGRNVEAAEVA